MATIEEQLTEETKTALKSVEGVRESSFQARAEETGVGAPVWLWFRCQDEDGVSPWWSPERDRELREFVKEPGNDILQGAVSSFIKKFKSMNWTLEGPEATVARMQPILADESELGQGWSQLVSKTVEDYVSQDVGAYWELIGDGPPDGPLEGLPKGVAHLDAGKVQLTGDPVYPILFWGMKESKRVYHKVHTTRLVKMTDMVSPNEDMNGVGFCSTSRVLSSSSILLKLARYKDQKLSDMPPAGILLLNNILPQKWEETQRQFSAERRKLGQDLWASVMTLTSVDPQKPISAEFVSFADLPDNFDEMKATEIYVNIVALAFGIDVRELWPLSAGPLGTGTEVAIQHQKAKGKGVGDILSTLERAVNWHLLPKRCRFSFDAQDDEEDQLRAEIEDQIVKTVMSMWKPSEMGTPVQAQEVRQMLADQSSYFSEEFLVMDLTDQVTAEDTEQKMYGPIITVDRFGNIKPRRRRFRAKGAIDIALKNYREGSIEAGQLAEFALLELADG